MFRLEDLEAFTALPPRSRGVSFHGADEVPLLRVVECMGAAHNGVDVEHHHVGGDADGEDGGKEGVGRLGGGEEGLEGGRSVDHAMYSCVL